MPTCLKRCLLALGLASLLAGQARAAAPAKGKPLPKPPPPPPRAAVTQVELAADARDPQRLLAEQFLRALSRQGPEDGLGGLLGGASLVSRLYTVDDWRVVGREKRRVEVGDLGSALALLAALDRERRGALKEIVAGPAPPKAGADVSLGSVAAPDSAFAFEIARAKAHELEEANPVFAYLACSDRFEQASVLDPFRKLLARAARKGEYRLELDQFWISSSEGHHEDKRVRRWPLFVVRLRAGKLDSGWRVLPTTETTGASATEVCR